MKFKAKVYWEMSGEIEVEADSPEEAAAKAVHFRTPLPEQSEYVTDSINCDPTCDVQQVIELPTLKHPMLSQDKLDGIKRIEAIAFQTRPGSCPP